MGLTDALNVSACSAGGVVAENFGVLETSHGRSALEINADIVRGLFQTIYARHPETAKHSLRVSVGCVTWSKEMGLSADECESLHFAALLHDFGKVAAPADILLKPTSLSSEEAEIVGRCRTAGIELVRHSLALPSVEEILRGAQQWYDGSRSSSGRKASDFPLAARTLSIIDAFDAMTTQQAYRPALSRNRAIEELLRHAGTQFDPALVDRISRLSALDPRLMKEQAESIEGRLSRGTKVEMLSGDWEISANPFRQQLVEQMDDAILFVDRHQKVIFWNRGAVKMTGIPPEEVQGERWHYSMLNLTSSDGQELRDEKCPVVAAIRTAKQTILR